MGFLIQTFIDDDQDAPQGMFFAGCAACRLSVPAINTAIIGGVSCHDESSLMLSEKTGQTGGCNGGDEEFLKENGRRFQRGFSI